MSKFVSISPDDAKDLMSHLGQIESASERLNDLFNSSETPFNFFTEDETKVNVEDLLKTLDEIGTIIAQAQIGLSRSIVNCKLLKG